MKAKQKGFTLIELMVVIAIIAVLVGMVIFAINPAKMIEQAKDSRARSDLNQVKAALQLYLNENGDYPTATQFTTVGGTSPPNFTSTYMKSLPSPTPSYSPTPANCDNTSTLCTAYTASITIYYITSDDNNAGSKCLSPYTNQTVDSSGVYWVCPD